jgi:transcriptional regulator with XRE-family HTH domain
MARKVPPPKFPSNLYYAREFRGLSQDDLANASGVSKGQISKLEKAKGPDHRELTRPYAEKFARPLRLDPVRILFWDKFGPPPADEESPTEIMLSSRPTPPKIRVHGEVAAGVWRATGGSDLTDFDREESLLPPDPRYPAEAQYDLIVRGTSINQVARDGDRLRVVSIDHADPAEGDLVIVERFNGDLLETTAKRIWRNIKPAELRPDSDDLQWHPISLDGKEDYSVKVIGIVLYAYRKTR